MKKQLLCLVVLLSISTIATAADDSVTALVGTQTFQCTLGNELKCTPANELQQKEIVLKKHGSSFKIADEARGLEALIDTSLSNGDMSYDITFCSTKVCTLSSSNGGPNGYINQTMYGQYNVTEPSFYVLGFFITTQATVTNLKEKIEQKYSSLLKLK